MFHKTEKSVHEVIIKEDKYLQVTVRTPESGTVNKIV